MNRQKNVIWAHVVIGGLLLATLGACSNDEPAATTGTPAPSNASSTDAAPIAGSSNSSAPSTSASTAPAASSASAPAASTGAVSAPKPLAASKPLASGTIAPDKPIPAEDVKAKPAPEKSVKVVAGGLTESQYGTMKERLKAAKELADGGKIPEAKAAFVEFAGEWDTAKAELKTKAAAKHDVIEAAVKAVDAAGDDKTKLPKAISDLASAIDKAK
jgi:hypothetical protein